MTRAPGRPFAGNQIPAGRISPIAAAILNNTALYPLPNRTVTGVVGNYVGERLEIIRAHQADVRGDWSASNNDKIFGRFSFAEYESRIEKRAFPLLLGSTQDAPFRNLAFNWNRIFSPSLVNEILVGYNQVAIVNNTLDWNGIGNANATFGIAGGQPIAGLSSIGWGGGLTSVGAGASDSDTLDKTYQINEKLIWLKGRHSMKFGGQLLHYVQRRFYAGNNGLLGLFGYGGAFTGFPFSDFLLDQVLSKGRGSQSEAWTHVHNRMALYVQDDFKIMPALTLNLGMRWAYTEPIVEKDNRQSNFDLSTGRQILPDDSDREGRALYNAYKKGFEPRLGFAYHPADRWVLRGGYGITQYMEGTGANLRLPLNPPFFFESAVQYDATTGAGTLATGFAELRPLDQPSGQVRAWDPNLRPQFTQQWNVFAEYLLKPSMSANVGYVGHNAKHLVAPVEGNQPLPGVGDPSTWAPLDTRRPLVYDGAAHHEYRDDRLARPQRLPGTPGQSAATQRKRARVPGLVYAGPGQNEQPRVLRVGGRCRRGRVLDEHVRAGMELRSGVLRCQTQPRVLGQLRAAVWPGTQVGRRRVSPDEHHSWWLEGERDLPGANGFPCHGDRWHRSLAARSARQRAAELRWGSRAVRPEHQPLARLQCVRTRSTWQLGQLSDWCRARARATKIWTSSLAKRFDAGSSRYFEFRAEAFNLTNTPSFGPPAADINAPNTFGTITTTISTARTVELVLKFFF